MKSYPRSCSISARSYSEITRDHKRLLNNCRRICKLNCDAFGISLMNLLLYLHRLNYCYGNKQFCRKFRALSRGGVIFFLSPLVWPVKCNYKAWHKCDRLSSDAPGIVTLWYNFIFLDLLGKSLWNSRGTFSVPFSWSLWKNFENAINTFSIVTIFDSLCMK